MLSERFVVEPIAALRALLVSMHHQGTTLLVGVDGPGGAGKSVFARALAQDMPNAAVVEMDDFFLPSAERSADDPLTKPIGGDFDWQRVRDQVLCPLSKRCTAVYRRYDWETDRLAEKHGVSPDAIVIVEGVYSTRDELASYYDFTIWVECPRELRLARGIARSGEQIRERWENDWMIAEDRYIASQRPQDRASLILDGSGMIPHDLSREYVRLFTHQTA